MRVHIKTPTIAPTIWLPKYGYKDLTLTNFAVMSPIVTDGLTWPPLNGPDIEIAKKLKQLIRNVQKGFNYFLEIGWLYSETLIPKDRMSVPKVSKKRRMKTLFLRNDGILSTFNLIYSLYLSVRSSIG